MHCRFIYLEAALSEDLLSGMHSRSVIKVMELFVVMKDGWTLKHEGKNTAAQSLNIRLLWTSI